MSSLNLNVGGFRYDSGLLRGACAILDVFLWGEIITAVFFPFIVRAVGDYIVSKEADGLMGCYQITGSE